MKPDFSEFKLLASQGKRIPVYRTFPSNGMTPAGLYERIRDKGFSYLLESAENESERGRFSVIGDQPFLVARLRDRKMEITRGNRRRVIEGVGDPLPLLRELQRECRLVRNPDLPPFQGGLVGYFNYDLIRVWERLPGMAPREDGPPESVFMASSRMILFDHRTSTITVIVLADPGRDRSLEESYEEACARVTGSMREVIESPGEKSRGTGFSTSGLKAEFRKELFLEAVRRVKEYIVAGDVIQTVISHRFSGNGSGDPFALYRALRTVNPSPYMFYLDCDEVILVGASPEILVRLTGGKIELRPIAGTRPRGESEEQDRRLEEELLADPKERAEHLMLVDLGRNDVGRVSSPGSVSVSSFMEIERYSHVMHIVSGIEGLLKPGKDCFDVFRSAFPAGTLTGAPKIRAMEIIHELEHSPRGPYGGAVGYFGSDGNMDFCITIRTIVLQGNTISVQTGAGIVYDSSPEKEYQECLNKAAALFKAIERAQHHDSPDR